MSFARCFYLFKIGGVNTICKKVPIIVSMTNSEETLRRRLYIIIFRSDTPAGKRFDLALLWLIVASIVTIILESTASFRTQYGVPLRAAEWIFTAAFSIEYLLRIYSSRKRLAYIFSFYGLIDLISVIPS